MRVARLLLLLHTHPLEAGLFQEMAVHMEGSLADVGKMPTDLQSTMTRQDSGTALNISKPPPRDGASHDVKNNTKLVIEVLWPPMEGLDKDNALLPIATPNV